MNQGGFWVDTLKEGKERFFQEVERSKGGFCPCCGRFGKVYKRKLNRPMANGLIWLFKMFLANGEKFVSIGDAAPRHVVRNGGSLASNRWWGFVEERLNPKKQRTSGYWKITPKGREFIRGEITVPSHCVLFNNSIQSFSGELIDISYALGEPFDYKELMEDSP
jgi:hypothetical protein